MTITQRLSRAERAERYLHSALESVSELRALVKLAENEPEREYYLELLGELKHSVEQSEQACDTKAMVQAWLAGKRDAVPGR